MQRISKQFASSFKTLLPGNSIRYAYQQLREAIVSEISMHVDPPPQAKATLKTTCNICLDDDIITNQMFSVSKCRHRFCSECMKRYIEVKLLEGSVIRCPQYRCKSKLAFRSCNDLLTPKLRNMWQQKIKEDSIPLTKRVYCPNPRCSALMSKNELSRFIKETGVSRYFPKSTDEEVRVRRYCFKCGQIFCINCKVPWHFNLSCDDYKAFGPNLTDDDNKFRALANQKLWRQCGTCKQMIERTQGCNVIFCRCGHWFCYQCGAKNFYSCRCGH